MRRGRTPETETRRLLLSDQPDQTWIARIRHLAATTEGAPALHMHVEGATLVFTCANRADLLECRRLIGRLIDQVNASGGSS